MGTRRNRRNPSGGHGTTHLSASRVRTVLHRNPRSRNDRDDRILDPGGFLGSVSLGLNCSCGGPSGSPNWVLASRLHSPSCDALARRSVRRRFGYCSWCSWFRCLHWLGGSDSLRLPQSRIPSPRPSLEVLASHCPARSRCHRSVIALGSIRLLSLQSLRSWSESPNTRHLLWSTFPSVMPMSPGGGRRPRPHRRSPRRVRNGLPPGSHVIALVDLAVVSLAGSWDDRSTWITLRRGCRAAESRGRAGPCRARGGLASLGFYSSFARSGVLQRRSGRRRCVLTRSCTRLRSTSFQRSPYRLQGI